MEEKKIETQKKQLIQYLKEIQAITSKEIENAFLEIKRENFVPKKLENMAYLDEALPIGFNQTISQPYTIAIMLELLQAKKEMTVGEIGSGSGYLSALLSNIVGKKGKVIGTEIIKELAEKSKKNLEKQGIKNVTIIQGEGIKIMQEHAPFDRIILSAACPFIPKELFDSITENGKIVAPVGDRFTQTMICLCKIKGKPTKQEFLKNQFVFVPLGGKHGFDKFS